MGRLFFYLHTYYCRQSTNVWIFKAFSLQLFTLEISWGGLVVGKLSIRETNVIWGVKLLGNHKKYDKSAKVKTNWETLWQTQKWKQTESSQIKTVSTGQCEQWMSVWSLVHLPHRCWLRNVQRGCLMSPVNPSARGSRGTLLSTSTVREQATLPESGQSIRAIKYYWCCQVVPAQAQKRREERRRQDQHWDTLMVL